MGRGQGDAWLVEASINQLHGGGVGGQPRVEPFAAEDQRGGKTDSPPRSSGSLEAPRACSALHGFASRLDHQCGLIGGELAGPGIGIIARFLGRLPFVAGRITSLTAGQW
jgi:hypothetical protein